MADDRQALLKAALASLTGRRTAEFEARLLAYFDERDRELLREALGQSPAYSATTIRLAHAAAAFIRERNQFANDLDCAKSVAVRHPFETETILRAGRRGRQQVNDLLREWGLI
jgi:hypothetical protein